mgnify:FL=1
MFAKKQDIKSIGRLKKRSDFLRVQQAGKKWVSKSMIVELATNDGAGLRYGLTVSKKVSKLAVMRNRIKRRLKATACDVLSDYADQNIDGVLIDHLVGTQALLKKWNASPILQDAGLYHAAYGTAGFSKNLVSLEQRDMISGIIGKKAEEIVYLYCSCDREYFWPQFSHIDNPVFRNRFTDQQYQLSQRQLLDFCELTAANELEIANNSQEFLKEHGQELYALFKNMQRYLSAQANSTIEAILGHTNA